MKRIGRYTLNVLTPLSLVMCMATATLWVRSYGQELVLRRFDREGEHWTESFPQPIAVGAGRNSVR